MEPGVPFALLGVVELLLVAAFGGLAAAGLAVRGVRLSSLLLAAGALLLGGTEVYGATRFGDALDDRLALLRAAAALLVTAGLALGALSRRPVAGPAPGGGLGAVVVPLAAAPRPAALAGLAALAAAGTALAGRRDAAGRLLAAGLALAAAAAFAAPLADDGPRAAVAVLVARGLAALALLAGLVALGRASLLAKVVTAIMAGVLAMATAAVAVVGTFVVEAYDDQAADLVTDAAEARSDLLLSAPEPLRLTAPLLALACTGPERCADVLQRLTTPRSDFVVRVRRDAPPQQLAGRTADVAGQGTVPRRLTATELLGLARLPEVRAVLTGEGGQVRDPLPAVVRLAGAEPGLAALAVAPGVRPDPDQSPRDALVYGVRLDSAYLSGDVLGDGFGVALVTGSPPQVSASNSEEPQDDAALLAQVTAAVEDRGLGDDGRLTQAAGARRPTLHVRELTDPRGDRLGLLAVTRDADQALASQRNGLTALLLSAVGTTGVVALLALLLGRRTVQPVRRLTLAAQRVAAGDLSASGPPAAGRDEVGVLARTFDAMTGSLARLTGDLRSSAARLETVLASMSDGLLATDADGRVTAVNTAALGMLGLSEPSQVVGRRLVDAVDVRDAAGTQLADPSLRLQDAPAEVHRPDGSTVPVRAGLTALRDADGVVLVLRDTTREREVERMKTEFLSNVSHELRTPLTPIRGYADVLASRPGLPPEKVAMFAGTILAESLKMNRVVDLLVDVASIEAGRVQVTPKDVDVRSLLDARLDAWRTRAPERADDLRRRVSAGLPTVHVDATWVGKALDELIDNAVKYTAPGTPITLVAGPAPGSSAVRVSVRDAGPGIPEAAQGSLFTSFEQVDGSATRRVGGLGLGLSFVGRLAEDAGFPLHVESAPGRGSEFALDLPPGEPLPGPAARRRPTARRGPAR